MELGLTFDKLLLIGIVAALIIGPERLPKAAETFASFVRKAGEYLRDAKSRMRSELGSEADDVDWRKLDPRQYDPRRIIRDALFEEPSFDRPAAAGPSATVRTEPLAPASRPSWTREAFTRQSPPPYDVEAT